MYSYYISGRAQDFFQVEIILQQNYCYILKALFVSLKRRLYLFKCDSGFVLAGFSCGLAAVCTEHSNYIKIHPIYRTT